MPCDLFTLPGYRTATTDEPRQSALLSLANTRDLPCAWLRQSVLDALWSEVGPRKPHDWLYLLMGLAHEHTACVWQYVQEHYGRMRERYGLADHTFGRLIEHVTGEHFHTVDQLDQVDTGRWTINSTGAGAGARAPAGGRGRAQSPTRAGQNTREYRLRGTPASAQGDYAAGRMNHAFTFTRRPGARGLLNMRGDWPLASDGAGGCSASMSAASSSLSAASISICQS